MQSTYWNHSVESMEKASIGDLQVAKPTRPWVRAPLCTRDILESLQGYI